MRGNSLSKYRLGLLALGVFTFIMAVWLLVQAGATKQDTNTYNKAQQAATKINNYAEAKLAVPASLAAAGVKDVPASITYSKKSDTSYRFCASYKSGGEDFGVASIADSLSGTGLAALGGSSSSPSANNLGLDTLSISPSHKKGNNCQTVTIYDASDLLDTAPTTSGSLNVSGSSSTDTSDPFAACNAIPLDQQQAYDTCIQNVTNQQAQSQVN